jgi:hypothetical protein
MRPEVETQPFTQYCDGPIQQDVLQIADRGAAELPEPVGCPWTIGVCDDAETPEGDEAAAKKRTVRFFEPFRRQPDGTTIETQPEFLGRVWKQASAAGLCEPAHHDSWR